MVHLSGSDFAAWAALGLMRKQMISTVLGTSPGIVTAASPVEQARVNAMLEVILPVSERAKGLRSDTAAIKHLTPADLNSVRAPTLIVSARDDRYDTYSGADFTARHIVGARFIGFAKGGHTWVGHDDAVMAAIVQLLSSQR